MAIRYYLIVYHRPDGEIRRVRIYQAHQRDLAYADRDRLELEKGPELEVVVLQARSWDHLRQTHGRYFQSLEELTEGAW